MALLVYRSVPLKHFSYRSLRLKASRFPPIFFGVFVSPFQVLPHVEEEGPVEETEGQVFESTGSPTEVTDAPWPVLGGVGWDWDMMI